MQKQQHRIIAPSALYKHALSRAVNLSVYFFAHAHHFLSRLFYGASASIIKKQSSNTRYFGWHSRKYWLHVVISDPPVIVVTNVHHQTRYLYTEQIVGNARTGAISEVKNNHPSRKRDKNQ